MGAPGFVLLTVVPVWAALAVDWPPGPPARLRWWLMGTGLLLVVPLYGWFALLDLPGWVVVAWLAGLSRLVVPRRLVRHPLWAAGLRLVFMLLLRWISLPLLFF